MNRDFLKILSLALAVFCLLAARALAAPTDDALGYWKFENNLTDEQSNFTPIYSTVENGDYSAGQIGQALFGGLGHKWEIAETWNNIQKPFSINFWEKRTGSTGDPEWIFEDSNAGNYPIHQILFHDYGNGKRFNYTLAGSGYSYFRWELTSPVAGDGDWHMVSFACDSAQFCNVYLDGELTAATNDSAGTTPDNFASTWQGFGSKPTGNTSESYEFLGGLDEVAIWNRLLSADEVLELYGGQLPEISWAWPPLGSTTSTLINDFNFWSLNYDSGTATAGTISVWYSDIAESYQDFYPVYTASATGFHFPKNTQLHIGEWLAEAYLLDTNFNILAEAGNSWTIISTSSVISYESASSTCANYGFIGEPLCLLFFQLFIPSQASLNRFTTSSDGSDLVSLATSKAPFSYIFQTVDVIGNLTASTTPTSSLAAIYSIGSALDGLQIKWVLGILIWILLVFWFFHRFKHFEI